MHPINGIVPTPLLCGLNERAAHVRSSSSRRRRSCVFDLLFAHHSLVVAPRRTAVVETTIEVGVMVQKIDERNLGVTQFDTTSLSLAIDDLQLCNPIDSVSQRHRVASVLLDDFAP